MKTKNKIILIVIHLLVIVGILINTVYARYIINKKQSITISSNISNVDITIDKTLSNIASASENTTFNVKIVNNNNYPIVYTILPSSSKFTVSGGVFDASLAENSTVDIAIVISPKSDVVYTTESDSASISVDVTSPYKMTKAFDLTVETFDYNLRDIQMNLLYKDKIKTGTPNFAENVTTEESSGIYIMADESGDSYYYRGVIDYNYVQFAGNLWRIIRINGDGSYRLILDENIGTSAFAATSSTTYNNIGYMYAAVGTPRANTYNSTIKEFLESWYTSNIEASYDNYVDKDAIFWQDRTEYTTDSNSYKIYEGWNRIVNNSPSIKPPTTTEAKADWFSVTTTKGNGKLSKPIGLITSDEVVLAGATMTGSTLTGYGTYYANTAIYLNLANTQPYGIWTMTPRRFAPNNPANSHMIVSKPQAIIYTEPAYHSTTKRYVKPVINLKSTVKVKGSGTKSDPYVIKSVS